jgi:hypothetical protein
VTRWCSNGCGYPAQARKRECAACRRYRQRTGAARPWHLIERTGSAKALAWQERRTVRTIILASDEL